MASNSGFTKIYFVKFLILPIRKNKVKYKFPSIRYFRHQKSFLHPAVNSVYMQHQTELIEGCCNRELILAGDGRADSPGHSAKFGSYTVLDLDTNKVMDFQLVQVLWYT